MSSTSMRAAFRPLPWLGGLLAAYLAVPLVGLLVRVGQSGGTGFRALGLWPALAVSVATASISALLIAVLGVPLAYQLARREGAASRMVGSLVQLPLALPPLMSGILLIYVVGPDTAVGRLFGGRLTDTMAGIVLAQTFVAAPFLVVAARSAFQAVDGSLDDVATTLGHREGARFWRLSLPIAMPGIAAGMSLAWLRAFGEFGATVILAYHPYSLPVYTYVRFGSTGLPDTLAPAVLAVAAALVMLTLVRGRPRLGHRRAGPLPTAAAPRLQEGLPVGFAIERRLGSFCLSVAHQASSPRLAILGASGAGKSATLRCLAGLLRPDSGYVRFGTREVGELPSEERRVGYVPQEAALFPHLSVWAQVTFGVGARPECAAYWLRALRLGGLEDRMPGDLSGGQRKRVALARALSCTPDAVLLDEPFSGLDRPVRDELRRELRRVQREAGLSTVLVTHDPEEAAVLADEVVVIGEGRVLQAGRWPEISRQPASPAVARLLGIENIHHGAVANRRWVAAAGTLIETSGVSLPGGTPVLWCVRPERIEVGSSGRYRAVVADRLDLGPASEALLRLPGGVLLRARGHFPPWLEAGAECRLDTPPEAVTVWPEPARPDGSTLPAARAGT